MELLVTCALMATACTLLLGGLLLYRMACYQDLQTLRCRYLALLHQHPYPKDPQLLHIKGEMRQSQQQQKSLDYQVLGVAVALVGFVASVLLLALGILWPLPGLSGMGLGLFLVGSGCLLVSVAANLYQIWHDRRLAQVNLSQLLGLAAAPSRPPVNRSPVPPSGDRPLTLTR